MTGFRYCNVRKKCYFCAKKRKKAHDMGDFCAKNRIFATALPNKGLCDILQEAQLITNPR